MKIVGIVAEYNPFHSGHGYHIARTRELLGDDCAVVAAMSGNFVQRGECAITDKWARTRMALAGGADLILELPTVWAASSAEHFASGAISILKLAGAEALSFGSESGDADALKRLADALDTDTYKTALRAHLDRGLPFAVCRQRAAAELVGADAALLESPNDNLGVEYLRAARRVGWQPEVVAVPRVGAAHDGGDHPRYPSASFVRQQILSGETPMENPAALGFNERAILARLRAMSEADFAALPDSGEGLSNRLFAASRKATTLTELYDLIKTKRYAHSRIRRMVLWAALGLTAADRPDTPPYLRVLGASERGRGVLKAIPEDIIVITKPTHGKDIPLLELEARCTDFYALCREHIEPCGKEWSTSPIMR